MLINSGQENIIVGQSWLLANLGFGVVRVCVSVLTGIELCSWWTDFKADIGACYCYGLVVIP